MSKSEDIDWDWIRFCYVTLCGNSIEDFYDATFPEIIYQIRAYKKFNTPQKENNNNNKNNNRSQSETETYTVDPETLARWAREEEMGG